MSRLLWIIVLLLAFSIWRTLKGFSSIRQWHQINAHSGKDKQPLPASIWFGPALWGSMMMLCAMALVVQGANEYYTNKGYVTFGQWTPVYPGARQMEYGNGISPSVDREMIIAEYTVTDPWETVLAYYVDGPLPDGWQHDRIDNLGGCWLKHPDGRVIWIRYSAPGRYKRKGQGLLEYLLYGKSKKEANRPPPTP